jgi:hypothetical protein
LFTFQEKKGAEAIEMASEDSHRDLRLPRRESLPRAPSQKRK